MLPAFRSLQQSSYAALIRHTVLLPRKRMDQFTIDSRLECNVEVNSHSGVPLSVLMTMLFFCEGIPTVSFIQPDDHTSCEHICCLPSGGCPYISLGFFLSSRPPLFFFPPPSKLVGNHALNTDGSIPGCGWHTYSACHL